MVLHLESLMPVPKVELLGPARPDCGWQAKAGKGFAADFALHWEQDTVTCPQGNTSAVFAEHTRPTGYTEIHVRFRREDRTPCAARADCTRAKTGPRQLTLRPHAEHEAIARAQQATQEWRRRHDRRAGVEGTISQAVRAFGLRRTRHTGLAKTHLQHVLTAIAFNLARLNAWSASICPSPVGRISR